MPVQHSFDTAGPWVMIPAFNEAATIADIAHRTLRQAKPLLVVDDGSTDGTAEAMKGLPLTLLRNSGNLGKGASLWRGFRHALNAGARGVITLDGDGQHAPEDIARIAAAARRHPDSLIIGARCHRLRRARFARYAANRVADFVIARVAGCPIEDSQSGFRFYPAKLLQQLTLKHGKTRGFVFESEVLIECARLGYPIITVPIETYAPSGARPSHFRPVLDVVRIGRMLVYRGLLHNFFPGRGRGIHSSKQIAQSIIDI
jgi:glycosyltransferase involved in cell wall biosynthesis